MTPRRELIYIACVALLIMVSNIFTVKELPAESPSLEANAVSTSEPGPMLERVEATPEAVETAIKKLEHAADRARRMRAALTFEDFKATVYREPFEGGKYIVNGDTPIANEKKLREFFEEEVKKRQPTRLILAQVSGMDAKWNQQQKRNLSYCVSKTFGGRYDIVVLQMASATSEWEKVAAVNFTHDSSQDENCGPLNAAVVFDVRPVNVDGEYLARAFFPNEPRSDRNVLIDESSFSLPSDEKLQLVGILRHELGHVIGFRHEHTRPESGTCFEDGDWRPLTSYDAFSVMHYPQCNGKGDWSLTLTVKDKSGAACAYGPTPPFAIDPTLVDLAECTTDPLVRPALGQVQTKDFKGETVAKGVEKAYGPFPVIPGSLLEITTGGTDASGDPDLYVRFHSRAKIKAYDCRPFNDGPVESCSLTVPANATQVFVMVHGYTQATYDLHIARAVPSDTLGSDAGAGQ